MVRYRRCRIRGGTYFFTVTLRDRRSDALVRHIHELKTAWRRAQGIFPHHVVAAVILPDHLHAVVAMAEGIDDYPGLWREIKKGFTRRTAMPGASLWQARFWEHVIRDEHDLAAHVDYVHINPLKHRLVARVADWPHSTFHRYVRAGLLAPDWSIGDTKHPDIGRE